MVNTHGTALDGAAEPRREFYEWECGCYYDRTSVNNDTLTLRTHMCGVHFDAGMERVSRTLDKGEQLTIDLPSREGD